MTEPFHLQQMAPQPRRRTWPIVVAAMAGVLAAGGAGAAYALTRGSDPAPETATAVVTAAASSAAPSAAPTPAATSGRLGQVVPVTLAGDRYTIAALRYARFDAGDGDTYGTVEARFCVDKKNGKPIEISSAPWALLYDEAVMTEQISGGGLKKPEYPSGLSGARAVQPGKCLRGWIHFTLLGGKNPEGVEYDAEMPSGETFTFRWRL